MLLAIYQINEKRDSNRVAFLPYAALPRFQHSQHIDCKIYDKVFEGEVDSNNLEGVYQIFNLDIPANYTGRSLSVSDIVEIKKSQSIPEGFYFCDDIGFKKVIFEENVL